MKKYSIIIVALIALVVIVFCVANQSSNETNVQPQGSTQAYLEGVANQISEAVKEEGKNEDSSNKEEPLEEETQVEAPNQVADNLEATDTQSEALESNEGDSPTSQYQEALNAFLKDGYYFKDGKKPEKIKSLASRVEILAFPEEAGILGMFSRTFDFEGIEPFDRRVDLVYVNTSNKKFEDVLDEIVDALAKHEIILKDDPAAFINFNNEVPIIGGMTIINLLPHYRSDRLDVYKSYEIVFIGYHMSFNKNEILYMIKRAADK